MADDTSTPVSTDAANPVDVSTRSTDVSADPAVADATSANGDEAAIDGPAAAEYKSSEPKEDTVLEATTSDPNEDTAMAEGDAAAGPAPDTAATNGTPAPKKAGNSNNNKRKSGAGVPEHKKKTPSKKKKKAALELHLNVQPGEMYMISMKGYQAWPVIIADEDMLPEELISRRPVSAKQIDGTYREDFLEGGKNAKDRRYPVMFLGTNEFSYQVNTELLPFDLKAVQKEVEEGNTRKMSKALWAAYEEAAEGHDLVHYKEIIAHHHKALQEEASKKAEKDAKKQDKQEKKEKTSKRKSTAAEDSDDVDMDELDEEAAPSAKKAKGSKKRKKDDESDGENEKPAKTPKTKLKLNNKAPKDASATKPKKETKPKKAKAKSESEEAEVAPIEEKPMTEAERLEKREKSVLYLRHRLQKGFLSRDQVPKEEEMSNMSDYLKQLEEHSDLEAEVIKKTKVHKVLKAIIKLQPIPKEEEYQFKKRSTDLLAKWTGALAADHDTVGESSVVVTSEPATNGVHQEEEKQADAVVIAAEKTEVSVEPSKADDANGDVPVEDTKVEAPVVAPDSSTEEVAEEPASS
ncbi:hypothetical protein BDV95DRAFT_626569 [Massariosphaeria phaeospora]|uniref:PWWP domain-containing protein n=1 Tax=Massariosphaeria phaeospora TaxID=100035 RepID=A0A7C8IAW1_9PLEO|nr:hypothetical protein BDV95DRAFT_626569 [Massariosphaeria phaeospora]